MRDFVRCLPDHVARGVMRELLKRLDNHSWTKKFEDGPQLHRKMNEAFVRFLQSMQKPYACGLLLDLGLRDADVVNPALVRKCLKKLHKSLESVDKVERILDVLMGFARNSQKTQRRVSIATMPVSSVLSDSVQELAAACHAAFPTAAQAWAAQQLPRLSAEERPVVEEYLGLTTSSLESRRSSTISAIEPFSSRLSVSTGDMPWVSFAAGEPAIVTESISAEAPLGDELDVDVA